MGFNFKRKLVSPQLHFLKTKNVKIAGFSMSGKRGTSSRSGGTLVRKVKRQRRAFRRTGALMSLPAAIGRSRQRLRSRNLATVGLLGIEKKFYDTNLNNTSLGANTDLTAGEYDPSTTSMISTPAQGDGAQNRDGKRIVIESAQVTGTIAIPAGEAQVNPGDAIKVALFLVLDTQSNAVQAQSEDVYSNLNNQGSTNVTPLRNLTFNQRFKILKRKTFDLTPQASTSSGANIFSWNGKQVNFDWFIKFPKGLVVNFTATGTTASIANVTDNSIHVMAFANTTSGAPSLAYNARIRFVG